MSDHKITANIYRIDIGRKQYVTRSVNASQTAVVQGEVLA
jgi:hypothetical protein